MTAVDILRAMRRWLAVFLLVLLPLQLTWAAAASYCQHERDAGVRHLGHHEHQHEADAPQKEGPASNTLSVLDADCAFCHLGCVKPVASLATLLLPRAAAVHGAALLPDPPGFLLAERIERPNWLRA
ncbi:DUF2946 family protein [Eleftheria terrae]|uniref:DUF2946 family protein n=1 Tax=Eleftheria terrae TaxID=1597781 RepID=UPI00263AA36F|nr:DUF2946 family protein [Eleftheria terrae]WKB55499.1 hypothetical protein N7L95_25820 [Eleftheria terrae]